MRVMRTIGGAFRPPVRQSVTDWGEANIVLGKESAEPGRIRIRGRTPYMVEILESFVDPTVETIVIKSAAQIVKTTAFLIMIAYAIAADPGPCLYVMPDEKTVRRFWRTRVKEYFYNSAVLQSRIPRDKRDFVYPLDVGSMVLNMGWAGSPASLASDAIRWLFEDEIDKFPPQLKEADADLLAEERGATFWNRKICKASTPTDGNGAIAVAYAESDQRTFHMPCPRCGEYQSLVMDQVKVPDGERNIKRIRRERLAWYECIHCKGLIDEREKHGMLARGVWCPTGCRVLSDGTIEGEPPATLIRGYHLSRLYSPWHTWSDVIAAFFRAMKSRKPSALKNFYNSWLGLEWLEVAEETEEGDIRLLERDYGRREVPFEVVVLFAGVDIQKTHVKYVVWGFGAHGDGRWLIDSGHVGDLERFKTEVLARRYMRADGQQLTIRRAGIDSSYRAKTVYEFCRRNASTCVAVKGSNKAMASPHELRKIGKDPKTGKPVKPPVLYLRIDTGTYKDAVHAAVASAISEDGNTEYNVYRGIDDVFCTEFTAEQKIIKRNTAGEPKYEWTPRYPGAPNHFWDATIYAEAVADAWQVFRIADTRTGPRPDAPAPSAGAVREINRRIQGSGRKSWNRKIKNWLDK